MIHDWYKVRWEFGWGQRGVTEEVAFELGFEDQQAIGGW